MQIAEIPFQERPVLELLDLEDASRTVPDAGYAGFGHARIDRVALVGTDARVVEHALLVAVHSADDGEALTDDVELEFVLGARSVTVLVSAFLERWLPRLVGDARAVVLVMCNPHRAVIRTAARVPVYYALGDVESWLDGGDVRLVADTWRTA